MTEFYRGGGTRANTISEVPSKIDEMLGNYKKIAIINPNKSFYLPSSSEWKESIINLNLDFIPKRIIATVEQEINPISDSVDSKYNFDNKTATYGNKVRVYITNITKASVKLVYFTSTSGRFEIKEIIAIE